MLEDIPVIEAYNKADLKPDTRYPEVDGTQIVYSARDEVAIDALIALINKQLFEQYPTLDFLIPFTEGQAVAYLANAPTFWNKVMKKMGLNSGWP